MAWVDIRDLSNRIYWSGGASSEGDVKGAIERALASCPVLKPVITNGHLYDLAGLEFQCALHVRRVTVRSTNARAREQDPRSCV